MENQIKIRQAEIGDLDDIINLNSALFAKEHKDFDDTLDLNWSKDKGKEFYKDRILNDDGFVYVAEDAGKIVGYLCGGLAENKEYRKVDNCAELEDMFVSDQYRSQGIGGKFVAEFIKWCKDNKFDIISVTASAGNEKAIDFYRRMGFKDYDLTLEMKI